MPLWSNVGKMFLGVSSIACGMHFSVITGLTYRLQEANKDRVI